MSVLARVPIDRVQADAAQVQWGRLVLTAVVGIFYAIGWGVGKTVRWVLAAITVVLYGAGRAAGWAFVAVRLGWNDAQATQARR